jgi:iron complex outermembrane recepter protein
MNFHISSNRARCVLMGATAAAALATGASAQPAPASGTTVGEIIVTARHREESLQRVPINISVVSGAQASAKNLNDIQDLSSQIPSVDFRTGASNKDQTVFVRGIGTISTSPGVEPSVSMVVDGVVMARPGQATVDLSDLDHVEVLNGPQGTLFGKNASAGVVNVVTKNPTNTQTGFIDAGYYEGDEYRLAGGVSGPIAGDQLKGLVTLFSGAYQGNVDNVYLHDKVNGYIDNGERAKFVYTPNNDLTLTLGADYTHSLETNPTGVWASTSRIAYPTNAVTNNPGQATLLGTEGVTASGDNKTIAADIKSTAEDKNGGVSLQADWKLGGGYTLTSITAFRDWRNVQLQDYDQMSVATSTYPAIEDIGHLHFDQTSEELRIASPKGGFIDYVAGLYYLDAVDNETYQRNVVEVGGATPGFNRGLGHYGSTDKNYALFGEANVNFTSALRLVVGARGIGDDLSFYNNRVSTQPAAITAVQPAFSGAGSETKYGVAGRVGLQYDISSVVTSYVTYSHGYMGPAYNVFFNQIAAELPPLSPETSDSYEIGLKGQFLDRRVQADVSAFLTNFQNYQANSTFFVLGSLVTNLVNAGSVRTEGVQADITAKPIRGLTLDFNGIFDDAYVVSFPCPAGSAASCNVNGEPMPFAPRWKAHTQAEYRWPLMGKLELDAETDYNWQSATQYQLAETPQTIQPAYGIWNASVGLISTPDGWSARVLVKNIANTHYSSYLSGGDEGSTGIVRWVPRDDDTYWGINLHKDF